MNASRDTVSWLTLERYAVGDLPESERVAVESALLSDDAARDCLAQIRSDVRELPPLPVIERVPTPARDWWSWLGWRSMAVVATVGAVFLWMRLPSPTTGPFHSGSPDVHDSIKGDAVAISLVRERDGSVAWDPTLYTSGDRFKVRVTCGMGGDVFANVVVHQDGTASAPLRAQAIACGNAVVLDGAFRLTGSQPARVCVIVSEGAPIAAERIRSLGPSTPMSACTTVRSVR